MNNALTFLLTVVIISAATVFAINNRYKVIDDKNLGTIIIDNWDFTGQRVIERRQSGNWYSIDVIKGGREVLQFEEEMKSSRNKKEEDLPPAI